MKTTQHGRNLWQLTKYWVFNSYLVGEEDGLTVVDAGLPGSADAIIDAAAQIGRPITRITLTHAHGDHIGSLDELTARLPQAEVLLTERTAAFLSGDLSLKADEPQAKLRGGFEQRSTTPTRLIAPGDAVGSLRVVAAPGHTPDHVAFFDERDGTLIAGDAFQTQGGTAVAGVVRWLFPLPAMATWHLPTAVESARRLLDLQPRRLAVGHGRVLAQPTAAMREAIHTAETKANG